MTNPEDDEYTRATKAVVDDTMRTDVLGPNMVRVLKDYVPANDRLQEIIADSIKNNLDVKTALKEYLNEHEEKRKGKWVDRIQWLAIGAIITVLVSIAIGAIAQYVSTRPQ